MSPGPPDPDFLHVNQKSRFLGEGGDPYFILADVNGQLWSVMGQLGSVRVSKGKLG